MSEGLAKGLASVDTTWVSNGHTYTQDDEQVRRRGE